MIVVVTAASAHDVAGELARRPYVRDGELVGALTTNGIALRDEDGVFRRVCAESMPFVLMGELAADGTYLGGTVEAGLIRIPPGTCDVIRDPDITGPVGKMARIGDAIVLVETLADGSPAVFRSDDDGVTFREVPAPPGSWRLDTLSEDGLGRAVVTGLDDGVLQVGYYEGDAYIPLTVPPDPDAFVLYALGPAPDGVGVTIGTAAAVTGATKLWASSDEGWVHLVDVPNQPYGYACLGGGCFVAVAGQALYRWDPALGPGSRVEVDGPAFYLYEFDDALWGCRERLVENLIEVSRDGAVWEPALVTGETLDRECNADCGLLTTTPPTTTTPPPETDPSPVVVRDERSCGCAPGVPGSGSWLVLIGLAVRRRA